MNGSDLIVFGSFELAAVDSTEITPYVNGSITVEEVLWGEMLSFLTGKVIGLEKVPAGKNIWFGLI
ncbi:MAG: hypothetical protein ACETWG_12975 [Candidatus Neomarinimicrobiota bacterium]